MKLVLPIAVFLVTACNREDGVEPPTPTENAQLDEASNMLDAVSNDSVSTFEDSAPPEGGNAS